MSGVSWERDRESTRITTPILHQNIKGAVRDLACKEGMRRSLDDLKPERKAVRLAATRICTVDKVEAERIR